MAVSKELEFQNLSTVHGEAQPKPPTIASAATIAPNTFLTLISGTVAIATVTPPVDGAHLLCFIFTAAIPTAFVTTGNIQKIVTPTQNSPVLLVWNPNTKKYHAGNCPP